jgi:hypothetical protein
MDPTWGNRGWRFNKPMLLGGIGHYPVIWDWSSRNPCSLVEWVLNNPLTWDYWSSRNPCSLVEWVGPTYPVVTWDQWSRNLLECAFIGCCCSSSCWKLLGISSCQSGENDELLRENWCPRWWVRFQVSCLPKVKYDEFGPFYFHEKSFAFVVIIFFRLKFCQ